MRAVIVQNFPPSSSPALAVPSLIQWPSLVDFTSKYGFMAYICVLFLFVWPRPKVSHNYFLSGSQHWSLPSQLLFIHFLYATGFVYSINGWLCV